MVTLESFIAELDAVVRGGDDADAIVKAVQPLLAELLADQAWLPDLPVDATLPVAHLLGKGDGWSVVLVAFPAYATTPVHDHLTWGLVGVVSGCEVETPYSYVDGVLRPLEPVRNEPGAISQVIPPDQEIHSIFNPLNRPSISVHVYGADLADLPRHWYDVSANQVHDYRSAYAGEAS
ncbi:cysteine dioxygenase family protein [Allorhizocola rhizosphaerae]|uniref:cysteine dioxygenase family protein n=1 Tax=Allorhizocola rhizosphaerae TaxID=1872709 RepID=UPI000E3ED87C|nr:cysteine dioxygenase family protein [Allorhizocola rhizosphaerae]